MPAADYLLIDISNSFTKLAFSTRERIGRPMRVPTKELKRGALETHLRGRDVTAVIVSSVVPEKDAVIRAAAGKRRVLFINGSSKLGVGVDYPQPDTIGADRLANAAAVAQLYGRPAIVVDFGTAVTFDVVSGVVITSAA
jgi:type III pantothenate kinase